MNLSGVNKTGYYFDFSKSKNFDDILNQINVKIPLKTFKVKCVEYSIISQLLEDYYNLITYYDDINRGNFLYLSIDNEKIIVILTEKIGKFFTSYKVSSLIGVIN